MKSTKKEQLQIIEALSNAKGPSGFEDEAVEVVRQYAAEGLIIEEDRVRNVYLHGEKDGKPIFMLDAHGDEVGAMVQFIRPNGTLNFLPLGGWSASSFPASKVRVRTKSGRWIPGIVAEKPVHFKSANEQGSVLNMADMVIDIGAVSAEDAVQNFGVQVGEPVISDVQWEYDEEHDIMIGKGFDCRIGVAAMLEAQKRLMEEDLEFAVWSVMSSQEEIGDRGIKVAINQVNPEVAICFEGCPADDTFSEGYKIQSGLKKGPMIRFMDRSMIANPRYMRDTIRIAEEKGIPLQTSVRTGGGNNGAVINLEGRGIPVIVIGIPVRYIHSHYGICSYCDYEAAVELAVEVVKQMTREKLAGF